MKQQEIKETLQKKKRKGSGRKRRRTRRGKEKVEKRHEKKVTRKGQEKEAGGRGEGNYERSYRSRHLRRTIIRREMMMKKDAADVVVTAQLAKFL